VRFIIQPTFLFRGRGNAPTYTNIHNITPRGKYFFYLRYSNLEFTAASGHWSAHLRPAGISTRIVQAAGAVDLFAGGMAPARVTNKRTAAANCAALRVFVHINFLVDRTAAGGRPHFWTL
jgi:hypothetical protein